MEILIGIICLYSACFSGQMFSESKKYWWFWLATMCLSVIVGIFNVFPK